jgi:hypothetical protein
MIPVVVTKTGTGSTRIVAVDYFQQQIAIGLFVEITSGAATYTVEQTSDDFQDPNVTVNWVPVPGLSSLSANAEGSLLYPVRGVRLTINSGSGTCKFTMMQAG